MSPSPKPTCSELTKPWARGIAEGKGSMTHDGFAFWPRWAFHLISDHLFVDPVLRRLVFFPPNHGMEGVFHTANATSIYTTGGIGVKTESFCWNFVARIFVRYSPYHLPITSRHSMKPVRPHGAGKGGGSRILSRVTRGGG